MTDKPIHEAAKPSEQVVREQKRCPAECDDGVDWSSGEAEVCGECEGSGTVYVTKPSHDLKVLEEIYFTLEAAHAEATGDTKPRIENAMTKLDELMKGMG